MATELFGNGWISGGNLYKRAREEGKGSPDGEPWYVTEDGTRWSAYDVMFKPDSGQPAQREDDAKWHNTAAVPRDSSVSSTGYKPGSNDAPVASPRDAGATWTTYECAHGEHSLCARRLIGALAVTTCKCACHVAAAPREDVRGETEQMIQRAFLMISALCQPRGSAGSREWIMSIPARPDHDPDIVISSALMAARTEMRQLRAERDELRREVARVLAPFARVWNDRPAFDVARPFKVECEVGEYSAWANAAALHAKVTAQEGKR